MLVIAVLTTCYRPLLFATVDPDVAAARGVPVRGLGIVFAALVGVVAAQAVQIVGALLVMSLLITPAAAAARVVAAPAAAIVTSVAFAEVAAVGGIVLSLAPGVPVSVFVATISFVIYLSCWLIGRNRRRSAVLRLSLSHNWPGGQLGEGTVRQQIAGLVLAGVCTFAAGCSATVDGKAGGRRQVRTAQPRPPSRFRRLTGCCWTRARSIPR